MSTLTEFLKQRAEKFEGQAAQVVEQQKEWRQSLEKLIDSITGWLQDAVNQNLLKVERVVHPMREDGLGEYLAVDLRITTPDARTVEVVPRGRYVVAMGTGDMMFRARGRVDISNGARKFMLYRLEGENWVIMDEDVYSERNFDRSAFEAALQRLLE